jgi:hypothetical protein
MLNTLLMLPNPPDDVSPVNSTPGKDLIRPKRFNKKHLTEIRHFLCKKTLKKPFHRIDPNRIDPNRTLHLTYTLPPL